MQADRVLDIVTESWQDNKLVSVAEARPTSARVRVSRPPEAEKLSWTQAAQTKKWLTFSNLDFFLNLWFPKHKKNPDLAKAIMPLSLTVVGNCHCYEGTYGLKYLSAWQSNLLKPGFYNGKGCHTDSLTILWKTKERYTKCILNTVSHGLTLKWLPGGARPSMFYILTAQHKAQIHGWHYHFEGCSHIHREH